MNQPDFLKQAAAVASWLDGEEPVQQPAAVAENISVDDKNKQVINEEIVIYEEKNLLTEGIDFFDEPYNKNELVSLSYTSFAAFAKRYLPISNKKYGLDKGDIHKILSGKNSPGKILDNVKKDVLAELKKIKMSDDEMGIWEDTVEKFIVIFGSPDAGQS